MNEDNGGNFHGNDGRFVSLKEYVEFRFSEVDKALSLAAHEYSRRLDALNGEHERIRSVQNQSVTAEKFDSYVQSASTARDVALQRVDERFEDHVKRYEFRQREIDQLIAEQRGAAEKVRELAADTARRSNRNIAFVGIGVSVVVVLMRLVGLLP